MSEVAAFMMPLPQFQRFRAWDAEHRSSVLQDSGCAERGCQVACAVDEHGDFWIFHGQSEAMRQFPAEHGDHEPGMSRDDLLHWFVDVHQYEEVIKPVCRFFPVEES